MLTCNCRLLLEVPIRRDRYVRRWPVGTARLLVYVARGGGAVELRSAFIQIMAHLSKPGERLFGYPSGVLVDDRRLRITLDSQHLGGAAERLGEYTWLVDCASRHVLEYLLRERAFESVAFFWTTDYDTARALVLAASQAEPADQDRYETALLKHAGEKAGFVFYSRAHDNLEILGAREFVLTRCFEALLPWAMEDHDA